MGFRASPLVYPSVTQLELYPPGSGIEAATYPLDVVTFGGLSIATEVTSQGTIVQILPAPGLGSAYRLHLVSYVNVQPSGSAGLCDATGALEFGIGTNQEPNCLLDGLVWEPALYFVVANGATSARAVLFYDVVRLPIIQ